MTTHAKPVEAAAKPMMDMNTTPLIDVLLVLLIMFIITVPPVSHSIDIDLPVGPIIEEPQLPKTTINKIVILPSNEIQWNGTPVTLDQLSIYLAQTRSMTPEPELQFQPDPSAVYDTVDRTMATIKRSGVVKFGFVGNEQYRGFGKSPTEGIGRKV
jgi:biopolymer transport protein ExbD